MSYHDGNPPELATPAFPPLAIRTDPPKILMLLYWQEFPFGGIKTEQENSNFDNPNWKSW